MNFRFYTKFRGKKFECYFEQIPPKFPHTSENFVGMTGFMKSGGKCGEDTIVYFKDVLAAFALNT